MKAVEIIEDKKLTGMNLMVLRKHFFESFEKMSNAQADGEFFKNTKVKGYLFNTKEEAEFIEHLSSYLNECSEEKVMNIFKIINSLAGNKYDTSWKM